MNCIFLLPHFSSLPGMLLVNSWLIAGLSGSDLGLLELILPRQAADFRSVLSHLVDLPHPRPPEQERRSPSQWRSPNHLRIHWKLRLSGLDIKHHCSQGQVVDIQWTVTGPPLPDVDEDSPLLPMKRRSCYSVMYFPFFIYCFLLIGGMKLFKTNNLP